MPGIGIIANPHSKLNKRNPLRKDLLGYILGEKGQLQLTSNLDELAKAAEEFHRRNISLLAINGGDGTISCTLTAFLRAYGSTPLPPIAILKGGTMNVLASNLRIRGNPEEILFRLVESYSGGQNLKIEQRNCLIVEDRLGFVFANGLAVNFLKKFYGNKTGSLGVMLLILNTAIAGIFKWESYSEMVNSELYDITVRDQHVAQQESCMLAASTLARLPFGARFFSGVRDGGSGFELVSVVTPPKNVVWKILQFVVKRWKDPELIRWLCEDALLRAPKHHLYTLDGEIFAAQSQEVKIKTGPKIDFVIV